MFGVVLVGTYTSVFIASPILIYLGVGTGRQNAPDAPEEKEPAAVEAPPARKGAPVAARVRR
jgi:preprotein translocase subunit SecF